jgi:hypothetical protein
MRTTLLITLLLGIAACDDAANTPAKTDPKTETAKKPAKIGPVAKADIKGKTTDPAPAKTDAKADDPPKPDTAPDPSSDEAAKIVELARLARAIAAKPEDAETILSQAGLDRGAFETQMLAVAKDQWRTDLYLTALAGADRAG